MKKDNSNQEYKLTDKELYTQMLKKYVSTGTMNILLLRGMRHFLLLY
jgi:hypothetical protein